MTGSVFLHFGGVLFCVGLACLGLLRDHRSFVQRVFALGMILLALEALFTSLSVQAVFPEDIQFWQRWRWMVAALLPGTWMIFSLSFSNRAWKTALGRWKWAVSATFLVPLSFVTLFASSFFIELPVFDPSYGWVLPLGWSGYIFHVFFLISIVLIMMLLERTLRASRGRQRWQIKFLVIGTGALFAARVYTGSQVLLFHGLNLELEMINAIALLVGGLMIIVAISRARFLNMDIYLSQTMLHHSITLLIVGIYLLAMALLAKALDYVDSGRSLPLQALIIFLALLALTILIYSVRLRLVLKQLISRHFRRPQYDYRKVWMDFTARTASLVEEKALSNTVVKTISEMLHALSVSLWLLDERQENLKLGGSTVFSETGSEDLSRLQKRVADLIPLMGKQGGVVDLKNPRNKEAERFKQAHPGFLGEARVQYCILLAAGGSSVGLITLSDRVGGRSLSFEELDMLTTIADQVAASLLNLRLSDQLQQAKEMEAFQTISALFVHDLKNLASKLSLLLQNMRVHSENPHFREDAFKGMSHCVEKIDNMCSRLFLLKENLELRPIETDLNEVVRNTLSDLDGVLKSSLVETFHPLPKVFVDPALIQTVLTNLVLNANEALENGGKIEVSAGRQDGWVVLSVSDNGCGMSKEFMDQCLFRPFKTTKKQGTGIGLFHSKMIVDAHKGQIEVESEEGKGTTFRVRLPLKTKD